MTLTRATSRDAYRAVSNARDSNGRALLPVRRLEVYEFICLNWHRFPVGVTRADVGDHFRDVDDCYKPRIREIGDLQLIHCVGTRTGRRGPQNDCWRPYGVDELDLVRARRLKQARMWRSAQKRLDRLIVDLRLIVGPWAVFRQERFNGSAVQILTDLLAAAEDREEYPDRLKNYIERLRPPAPTSVPDAGEDTGT